MSVEIAWKQNILVTDFHLLKSLLGVLGFGSQAFICGFNRQNICSVAFATRNLMSITKLDCIYFQQYFQASSVQKEMRFQLSDTRVHTFSTELSDICTKSNCSLAFKLKLKNKIIKTKVWPARLGEILALQPAKRLQWCRAPYMFHDKMSYLLN